MSWSSRNRRHRALGATLGVLLSSFVSGTFSSWRRAAAATILAPQGADTGPEQVMGVDIRGAVAAVTLTRKLRHCDGLPWKEARARGECVVDLALPRGAAMTDVEVRDGGGASPSPDKDARTGLARYREALRAAGVEPSQLPFDDDARYRVRVLDTSSDGGKARPVVLKYSFVTPLELAGDQAFIAFPPALELSPPETRIEVVARTVPRVTAVSIAGESVAFEPAARPLAPVSANGAASMRAAWRIALTLASSPVPGQGSDKAGRRIVALASSTAGASPATAPGKVRLAVAVGVCPTATAQAMPDRVLFVIDRSRSVGPGGLEAERELALQLLRRLPPSTRFDALFFDRRLVRLFPVARTATRQAMAALADEMVPDRLANGTELTGAIDNAMDLLRRESADFGPHALLALLTDGAVGVGAMAEPATLGAKAALPALAIAAMSIRPNDDPEVSREERLRLKAVARRASGAGVEVAMTTGDMNEALDAVQEQLRRGGAIFDVRVSAMDSRSESLASDITPGEGVARRLELERPTPRSLAATSPLQREGVPSLHFQDQGTKRVIPLPATRVPERFLSPLFGDSAERVPLMSWVSSRLAALWEPVVRTSSAVASHDDSNAISPAGSVANASLAGGRGFMERSVVRDALSLAYTPRARACYLIRPARTPADRELSGRVRIAIDMLRGEVVAARVLSSTLERPAIETCLQEAAFALEVPRAHRNDDAVTAVLNLVFRPRTPEYHRPTERTEFDRELELVIESAGGGRDAGTEARAPDEM